MTLLEIQQWLEEAVVEFEGHIETWDRNTEEYGYYLGMKDLADKVLLMIGQV